jgi:type 1 fimbria pilin
MKRRLTTIMAVLIAATVAHAGTQATNTNTVSPTLQVTANVQKAVQLTLSTGTVAAAHCAVAAGGGTDYSMNFGTVDGLGINAGNCNKFSPTTPGVTNAVYWSDYQLTPVFSSQSVSTNTITAQVTTTFGGVANGTSNLIIVRDSANSSTLPASAASFSNMGSASADTIATNAANGTAITRYIGIAVTPANGASVLTGNQSATVTFTLTVQ